MPGEAGKKKFEQYAVPAGSAEHAETVVPDGGGVMSVVLSASCVGMNTPFTSTSKSMDPVEDSGNRARDLHAYDIRARRMAWVHELGHTLYPAYKAEWERLVTPDVKTSEGSPTGYAAEKPVGEEDFCESFMVLALYSEFKKSLGPTRTTFFERHPELLVQAPSGAPKPALAPKV